LISYIQHLVDTNYLEVIAKTAYKIKISYIKRGVLTYCCLGRFVLESLFKEL